jgi:hypothetical protein
MTSDLVTARHLCRKAVIYIRQSTPHQVISNQESLRLQYALRQRAGDLGWQTSDIEVVDTDLGLSGATVMHREGFKDVIARVTLGEVGIILSYEVTRLARNCSDGTVKLSGAAVWRSRGGQVSIWNDASRSALCWLSLPRRTHQLRGLAVFPVPIEPAHG